MLFNWSTSTHISMAAFEEVFVETERVRVENVKLLFMDVELCVATMTKCLPMPFFLSLPTAANSRKKSTERIKAAQVSKGGTWHTLSGFSRLTLSKEETKTSSTSLFRFDFYCYSFIVVGRIRTSERTSIRRQFSIPSSCISWITLSDFCHAAHAQTHARFRHPSQIHFMTLSLNPMSWVRRKNSPPYFIIFGVPYGVARQERKKATPITKIDWFFAMRSGGGGLCAVSRWLPHPGSLCWCFFNGFSCVHMKSFSA